MSIDTIFTHFPSLTTDRLHMRQLRPEDAEALFAIKSDPEVTQSYLQEPSTSLADVHTLIERTKALYERRKAFLWGITFKGVDTVIGTCTLWNIDPEFHYAEMGYEMNRAYWRQGIMTEVLPALLSFGFNELGLHRIEAITASKNEPSKGLLLKFGFAYEGNARQRIFFRGLFEDELQFGLLEDEWRGGAWVQADPCH